MAACCLTVLIKQLKQKADTFDMEVVNDVKGLMAEVNGSKWWQGRLESRKFTMLKLDVKDQYTNMCRVSTSTGRCRRCLATR